MPEEAPYGFGDRMVTTSLRGRIQGRWGEQLLEIRVGSDDHAGTSRVRCRLAGIGGTRREGRVTEEDASWTVTADRPANGLAQRHQRVGYESLPLLRGLKPS